MRRHSQSGIDGGAVTYDRDGIATRRRRHRRETGARRAPRGWGPFDAPAAPARVAAASPRGSRQARLCTSPTSHQHGDERRHRLATNLQSRKKRGRTHGTATRPLPPWMWSGLPAARRTGARPRCHTLVACTRHCAQGGRTSRPKRVCGHSRRKDRGGYARRHSQGARTQAGTRMSLGAGGASPLSPPPREVPPGAAAPREQSRPAPRRHAVEVAVR